MSGDGVRERAVRLFRDEPVLVVSGILALASMLIVPPSAEYVDYIDFGTICILFCFMAVVAVMTACGAFESLSHRMIEGGRNVRMLCTVLVVLPFVCSAAITNDIALITFVPLAISVLTMAGLGRLIVPVVVLQTAGANLGCMITPFGSPHNLYLFSSYGMSVPEFFLTLLPLLAVGTVLILAMTWLVGSGETSVSLGGRKEVSGKKFAASLVLFAVCIAGVLDVIPYWAVLPVVTVSVLFLMPSALRKVDYTLLLTFVFLFVFTGNVSNVEWVGEALGGMMSADPILTSALASQFVSNVPTGVMLSGFAPDWHGILLGINAGGFGTPIASMASLISLKIYLTTEDHDTRRYMLCFATVNAVMLAALLAASYLF